MDSQLKKNQTNLITGIIGIRNTNIGYCYYNSIIVLGNSTPYHHAHNNRYNKHHLVLFAEKFPLKRLLGPLFKIFNLPVSYIHSGYYLQPQLNAANVKITAAICYEIVLGNQMRENFKCDTNFLLTIANNAWFGDSIGPWQYLQMARMRAAELGRPLLCSTNNGITAIIDSKGVILAKLPQFVSAVLNMCVIPTVGMTLYAKYGCKLFWYFTIITFIVLIILSHKNNKLYENMI